MTQRERCRTLFISDVHLGARACQAGELLAFLKAHDAETIYLVGDIIDGWALKSSWYWPDDHNDVIGALLEKAKQGTQIIYLPGNHDEFLRSYYGTHFGGIVVQERAIHETADGKRYLVLHGDAFDFVIGHAPWLAHLGDQAYRFAIYVNRIATAIRRRMGLPYWSLSQWAKLKVKKRGQRDLPLRVGAVGRGEEVRRAWRDLRPHPPCRRRMMGDVRYLNTGDWVESCTAIVERPDGRLEIVRWAERPATTPAARPNLKPVETREAA